MVKMLYGNDIAEILSNYPTTRSIFRGCWTMNSWSKIEDIIDYNGNNIIIVNTASFGSEGHHWLLLFVGENSVFFDSLGHEPAYYSLEMAKFVDYIMPSRNELLFRLQGNSDLCGEYCVFYAINLSKGFLLDDITKKYFKKGDCDINDKNLLKLFKNYIV